MVALSSQALRPWTSFYFTPTSSVSKSCWHYLPKTVRIQPLLITSTATTPGQSHHHLSPRWHAKHRPTPGSLHAIASAQKALSTGMSLPSGLCSNITFSVKPSLSPKVPLPVPPPPCFIFLHSSHHYFTYYIFYLYIHYPLTPHPHIRLLSSRRAGVFFCFVYWYFPST